MLPCKPTGTGFAFLPPGLTRLFCALICLVTVHVTEAAIWTWNGNGGNGNWGTGANWGGTAPVSASTTDLQFAGTNNTGTLAIPLFQNIDTPFLLNSLTFNSTAGSFFLGGGALRFDGGATNSIVQMSSSAQNIANAIDAPSTNGQVTLTLAGDGTGVVTMSGVIEKGSGQRDYAIVKNGASTFSLSGANTYSGGTTINGGTLIVNSAASLGTGGLTLNAGTLEVATGYTSTRAVTVNNAASTFQIDPYQTFTLNAVIAGGGTLNKIGTGTMVLGGANTYSGGTIISAGTLRLGAAERLLNTGALTISGGSFDLQTFAETVGTVTLSNGSIIGTGTLSGSAYAFQAGTVSASLNGTAALTKSTSGTLTLSGANSYSGGTTINGGTLIINTSANLGAIGGGLTINAGTLEITNGFTTIRAISLGDAASTFQVDAGTFTANTAISGTGTLNKTGSGTMVLGAANLFSGGTNVTGGILRLNAIDRLLTSGAITILGGTFDLQTFTQSAGAVTLSSGSITGTGTGQLTASSFTLQSGTASAILAGNGTVTKNTAGTVTLSGANTFTGSTTINAGTLQVNSNNALGTTASGTTVANGAVLRLNNVNYSTAEALTLNGNGTGNGALTNTGTSTFAGPINAATNATINAGGGTLNLTGGLTKNGTTLTIAGGGTVNITLNGITGSAPNSDLVVDNTTVVLSAASSYNGPTTVQNNGTLQLGGNNVLPASPQTAMTVNTSTFDLASYSDGVASLTGNSSAIVRNSVTGGTSTLTVNPATGVSTTFAGVISGTNGGTQGNIALQKNGAGTLILTGVNTYSGTTTINNGTLTAAAAPGSSALGSTSGITVNSGGTLMLGEKNQINNAATMTLGGGTFAKGDFSEGSEGITGLGALTLTAAGSKIDFGTGSVGILTFAGFTPGAFTLTVSNWTGTPSSQGSGTTDRLIFDTSQAGNLGSFTFSGYSPGVMQFDLGNGYYEVTPISAMPEPSTYVAAALALVVVGFHQARRLRRRAKRA